MERERWETASNKVELRKTRRRKCDVSQGKRVLRRKRLRGSDAAKRQEQ